jgi:Domain of unknown function (DUF1844)
VAAEQEEGFIVRDRRGGTGSDHPSTTSHDASGIQPNQEAAPSDSHQGSGIPVTFSSFVISLGSSSMMLMGEQLDPQQPPMPPNLPQAKDIIDLLSVLETKTTGNLTTDEQAVLRDMLYALRMKYVSLASK